MCAPSEPTPWPAISRTVRRKPRHDGLPDRPGTCVVTRAQTMLDFMQIPMVGLTQSRSWRKKVNLGGGNPDDIPSLALLAQLCILILLLLLFLHLLFFLPLILLHHPPAPIVPLTPPYPHSDPSLALTSPFPHLTVLGGLLLFLRA